MKLRFLGAAGTVTGSKYLLTEGNQHLMVDCGLYQGVKNLRERNWKALPMDPATVNAIVLTHAHIDHSGYIPALMKAGFHGKIYCTQATYELCRILLPDSGFLQEEDAHYANLKKFSRHSPALPLYTEKEALASLKLFEPIHFHEQIKIGELKVEFRPAGHILGSASVRVSSKEKSILFSGDIGRQQDLVMRPPEGIPQTDYLVVESTYGDRLHDSVDAYDYLAEIINKTFSRGGIVLLPSFAVGRTQTVLYIVERLKEQGRIPNVPVYLNSPMAISATETFCKHHKEHRLTKIDCEHIDRNTIFIRTAEESMELNGQRFPSIIVSASGMATGGRVLHHLKALAPNHKNSIVFLGFQAPGTRGDAMVNGAKQVKIHGKYYPVNAEICHFDALSAHGDYEDILTWLGTAPTAPINTFITHGESTASDSLRTKIKERLGWRACVPEHLDEVEL